jgi:hypothetical protein
MGNVNFPCGMNTPVIKKIIFTKEVNDEIDKINKGEPIKRTRTSSNRKGYSYEVTTNRPLSDLMAKKRLIELYGGTCSRCGAWPSYIVTHNVGDELQGAWLVERYCCPCFEKWKDKLKND